MANPDDVTTRLRAASARLKEAIDSECVPEPQVITDLLLMGKFRLDEAADLIDLLRRQLAERDAALTKLNHTATDRQYMMTAYWTMLGPVALKVAAMWRAKGVSRVHHDWGPDASSLTGEERAQAILDVEGVLGELK